MSTREYTKQCYVNAVNQSTKVDLLIATDVEGLRVQNRLLLIDGEGRLRKTSYHSGVKEFFVSYGNDVEVLLKYKEENDIHDKVKLVLRV
ncbi:hypothetical protein CHS0354_040232 [Potamilus streckersoni]|uniref:Uncharacterized protein n=1 Tax=Potamilus streckersoni TaxID=2493646 RepID=A0AAE0VQH7_9BIVA|nr:hypothetical protein CHS0354_040232 [Potamilus streckersoni]